MNVTKFIRSSCALCTLYPFLSRCWCVLAFSTYYVYVIWEILRDQIIARLGWRRGEKSNIPNLHKEEQSVECIYISYEYRGFLILFLDNIILSIILKYFRPWLIKSCNDTLWFFKVLIFVYIAKNFEKINHQTYLRIFTFRLCNIKILERKLYEFYIYYILIKSRCAIADLRSSNARGGAFLNRLDKPWMYVKKFTGNRVSL